MILQPSVTSLAGLPLQGLFCNQLSGINFSSPRPGIHFLSFFFFKNYLFALLQTNSHVKLPKNELRTKNSNDIQCNIEESVLIEIKTCRF